ncbi:baculoviral IAP repeat-containing protein 3-like isoform X2 [Girardinichthys multiradiatus]|uniref:baculoviral IAP repeat-containing protein 3-like isoform X2 n=1 Tax=Girardinichthys multiradiatus TaxID=208333 RepID=UPI001FAB6528|nr:baculoviral IAP repeat-containing protein 3-like isoform X2 [Girardinichthys multiradiatus]
MASMQPSSQTKEASSKSAHLAQTLMCIRLMEANEPSAVSFENKCNPLECSQRTFPENSLIVREALRMNMPRHLVLIRVQKRLQTIGSNYTDLKDLVADLFEEDGVPSSLDQEVPMETNQLEEAMMMNSLVVKKALRLGVPPDLITPLLRAKILSSGAPYCDVHELLTDVNKN